MTKRKIIQIDNKKCNGCGVCIPNCPEGAIQIIDNKARLISDLFCDGLGACIGHCPTGAITVIEREAELYDESKVMENIIKQGKNTIIAHLKHLKDHNEMKYYAQAVEILKKKNIKIDLESEQKSKPLACGCPGSAMRKIEAPSMMIMNPTTKINSELRQWPVQLNLLPPQASFFNDADLLISADCVGFANPNFHTELLKGKAICIGCPKLDDIDEYKEKIFEIISSNDIKSITVAIMEVPCCRGLYAITEQALEKSGKDIPLTKRVVSVNGTIN